MMDIEISKDDNLKNDNVDLHTPRKSQESKDLNHTNLNQNSPCQMHQIQEFILMWMELIKKYNNGMFDFDLDPDVILMIHQMNEVLQTIDQTSSQKQFNFTPKQQNNDENSFNNSFKQDMFQKLNDNIIQLQEEIKNQVCQSPKTIENGKYYNETCSEITQQVNKTEHVYKSKNDEEFCKEFDQCKSKCSGSYQEELPLNSQSHKQTHKFEDIKKNRILSFRKHQHVQIEEFKKSLTEMKTVVGQRLQREITIFKEDVLSEHSKFSKSYSELQEQINTYQEMVFQFTQKIEKLEQIIQDQKQQIDDYQSNSNSEQFIFQLTGFVQNDKTEINNIEDAKTKIMEHIMTQSQQVQSLNKQLQMTNQNNQNMIQRLENDNQLNKNKFGTEKKMLEFQIINNLQQYERNYQQLNQELEQLRLSDWMSTNQELITIGYIQMKQQQQLIQIAATVLQQFINTTVFQLNVVETIQEQLNQLKLNEEEVQKQITNLKGSQENTIECFHNNKETIYLIIQILCMEYTKVINKIIKERKELEQQLC